MYTYYKITAEEAQSIGKFSITNIEDFDPFVGKQKDGTFLVRSDVYEKIKLMNQIKDINFNSKEEFSKDSMEIGKEPVIKR